MNTLNAQPTKQCSAARLRESIAEKKCGIETLGELKNDGVSFRFDGIAVKGARYPCTRFGAGRLRSLIRIFIPAAALLRQ